MFFFKFCFFFRLFLPLLTLFIILILLFYVKILPNENLLMSLFFRLGYSTCVSWIFTLYQLTIAMRTVNEYLATVPFSLPSCLISDCSLLLFRKTRLIAVFFELSVFLSKDMCQLPRLDLPIFSFFIVQLIILGPSLRQRKPSVRLKLTEPKFVCKMLSLSIDLWTYY